jgi:hypothetical protein
MKIKISEEIAGSRSADEIQKMDSQKEQRSRPLNTWKTFQVREIRKLGRKNDSGHWIANPEYLMTVRSMSSDQRKHRA